MPKKKFKEEDITVSPDTMLIQIFDLKEKMQNKCKTQADYRNLDFVFLVVAEMIALEVEQEVRNTWHDSEGTPEDFLKELHEQAHIEAVKIKEEAEKINAKRNKNEINSLPTTSKSKKVVLN